MKEQFSTINANSILLIGDGFYYVREAVGGGYQLCTIKPIWSMEPKRIHLVSTDTLIDKLHDMKTFVNLCVYAAEEKGMTIQVFTAQPNDELTFQNVLCRVGIVNNTFKLFEVATDRLYTIKDTKHYTNTDFGDEQQFLRFLIDLDYYGLRQTKTT